MIRKYLPKIPIVLLVIIFISVSCVKNIDFDQAEEFEITPTLVASLVFSNLNQRTFVSPGGVEVGTISDKTKLDVFGGFIGDNLEKLDLNFEMSNQFNRRFRLNFRFLDEMDQTLYTIPQITIAENVKDFKIKEEIDLLADDAILSTKKLEITLELVPSSDGSIIDINEEKLLTFKSAATFYFRIN